MSEANVLIGKCIDQRRLELGKTNARLAAECGFASANIVSMITRGTLRLPLERVELMAQALELDPMDFMLAWLALCEPFLYRWLLAHTVGWVSEGERRALEVRREPLMEQHELESLTDEAKEAVRRCFHREDS